MILTSMIWGALFRLLANAVVSSPKTGVASTGPSVCAMLAVRAAEAWAARPCGAACRTSPGCFSHLVRAGVLSGVLVEVQDDCLFQSVLEPGLRVRDGDAAGKLADPSDVPGMCLGYLNCVVVEIDFRGSVMGCDFRGPQVRGEPGTYLLRFPRSRGQGVAKLVCPLCTKVNVYAGLDICPYSVVQPGRLRRVSVSSRSHSALREREMRLLGQCWQRHSPTLRSCSD